MQLMFGYSSFQPCDYGRLVIVIVQVSQVTTRQWPDTTYNFPECGVFDGIDAAVGVLPESSYHFHDFVFCPFLGLGVIVEPIANQNIRNVFYEGKAAAADYVRGCAGRFNVG